MKRIFFIVLITMLLVLPVSAAEITAPPVPDDAEDLMPVESSSFGEDLWEVIKKAVGKLQPEIAGAAGTCLSLLAVVMLISIVKEMPGKTVSVIEFSGVLAVAALLLQQTNSMIDIAANTVAELSEYGKLFLPAMTAALAAQGGATASAALYAGTAVFDAILSSAISMLLLPMVYVFLVLSIAGCATRENILKKLRDFVKWLMTWGLKTLLYIFTGYMGITGVVSGTADEAAVKATKLTMSGMIPVVGGILSDASEAVIVGAGLVKSAVGVYGMLAVIAIWISPFLQIGLCYLLLKLTAMLSETFGVKQISGLIKNFSEAMGLLLAMTGAVCILLLVSTVCFMKGMG